MTGSYPHLVIPDPDPGAARLAAARGWAQWFLRECRMNVAGLRRPAATEWILNQVQDDGKGRYTVADTRVHQSSLRYRPYDYPSFVISAEAGIQETLGVCSRRSILRKGVSMQMARRSTGKSNSTSVAKKWRWAWV